jgi:hypothetical protein
VALTVSSPPPACWTRRLFCTWATPGTLSATVFRVALLEAGGHGAVEGHLAVLDPDLDLGRIHMRIVGEAVAYILQDALVRPLIAPRAAAPMGALLTGIVVEAEGAEARIRACGAGSRCRSPGRRDNRPRSRRGRRHSRCGPGSRRPRRAGRPRQNRWPPRPQAPVRPVRPRRESACDPRPPWSCSSARQRSDGNVRARALFRALFRPCPGPTPIAPAQPGPCSPRGCQARQDGPLRFREGARGLFVPAQGWGADDGTSGRRRVARRVVRHQEHGRPFRAQGLRLPPLDHRRRLPRTHGRRRLQGGARPLPPLCLARLPLGPSHAHRAGA